MKSAKLFFVAIMLVVSVALAWPQGPGLGARIYDPSTETTIKGTVEEVREQSGRRGWKGVHLLLKAEDATVDVHVGPSAYLSQQGFSLKKGDVIAVTGSRVRLHGVDSLIAREITKNGQTLALRDAQGVPKWSRGRRAN
jgi:hypothetical protein